MSQGSPPGGSTAEDRLSTVFQLLSRPRRRRVLYVLREHDGSVPVDRLAELVREGDAGGSGDTADGTVDGTGTADSETHRAVAGDGLAAADDGLATADDGTAAADDGIATAGDGLAAADDGIATADDETATAGDGLADASHGTVEDPASAGDGDSDAGEVRGTDGRCAHVATALRHVHLPKLVAAGAVERVSDGAVRYAAGDVLDEWVASAAAAEGP